MITYMTHPDHGTHIAYSDAEVDRCKNNGWSVRGDKKEPENVKPERPVLSLRKKVTHGNGQ